MGKSYHMTWVPGSKRWAKEYKGKSLAVSCRQLGVPATKDNSWQAANAWWEKKQKEIDATAESLKVKPGTSAAMQKLLEAWVGRPLVDATDASIVMTEFIDYYKQRPIPSEMYEAALGAERVKTLENGVVDLLDGNKEVASDRTVGGQIKAWLEVRRAAVAAGGLDPGRYDSYRRALDIFSEWCGVNKPVEVVTSVKLEQFQAHLLTKVGERREWERQAEIRKGNSRPAGMSSAYAHTVLGTVKMFTNRLADHGLIPRPGNLRNLRISPGKRRIEVFTVEEIKTLFKGCTDRSEKTKLYLLLMANAGMYQSDISDLGVDEVDFRSGTITRPRSKTPDGPVVRYKLWPETLQLLRKFRNKDSTSRNGRNQVRVLTTDRGGPLVPVRLDGGRLSKSDNIQSAYRRLLGRLKIAEPRPLKLIRKTSATLLSRHPQYKYYVPYFLGHSPRSMADQSYIRPEDTEFFKALDWLRHQYGFSKLGAKNPTKSQSSNRIK